MEKTVLFSGKFQHGWYLRPKGWAGCLSMMCNRSPTLNGRFMGVSGSGGTERRVLAEVSRAFHKFLATYRGETSWIALYWLGKA
jgi:hypothetical protein